MRRTLTRLGLGAAVLTATIGLGGAVANAAPATGAHGAATAQAAMKEWTYLGSYERYEWCRQNLMYYWPAFDAQCVYNGRFNQYDLWVWM